MHDASRTACYYCPGPKAQVNTVLAVIDLEGISLSIWPKYTWKTEHRFQSRLCTCAPTQTTKQPLYLSYLNYRIKKCLMAHGITEAYACSTYYTFCYSFCLTVQLRITNISNVCLTPYRPTVMIRIREICMWSKTMAILTILSCRSAMCI